MMTEEDIPTATDVVDFAAYTQVAKQTESIPLDLKVDIEQLIMTLQLVANANQLLDLQKKNMFYGKAIDVATVQQFIDSIEFVAGELKKVVLDTDSGTRVANKLPVPVRVSHGIIGISTEAGELVEALIPVLDANFDIDAVNIKEEIGDVMWYAAVLLDSLRIPLSASIAANQIKLTDRIKGRYGRSGTFSQTEAIDRNVEVERTLLESN